MAARLILDTVTDAQIETIRDRVHIRRTGLLLDFDTVGMSPEQIFAAAINFPGMPRYFDPYPYPAYAYSRLNRHMFDAISNQAVKVTLLYEPVETDLTGGISFVLTRSTKLIETTTELHPKDLKPLRIAWKNPLDVQAQNKYDTVGLKYLAPLQVISVAAWVKGAIPDAMLNCLGCVNSLFWRNGAVGKWLCTGEEDRTQDRMRSSNFSFEFSRWLGPKDWSSYAVYRDRETGLALKIDPNDMKILQARAYKYGTDEDKNGILKAGLYDLADFRDAFKFGGLTDTF